MKTSILAIALLTLLPSALRAEDQNQKEQLMGLWLSPDKDSFFSFEEDGKYRIIGDGEEMKGTWKQDPDTGNIQLSSAFMGKKLESAMKVKFDGEAPEWVKADFIVEGKTQTYTRPKREMERKQVIGTWKCEMEQTDINAAWFWVGTYKEDGKATYKTRQHSKEHKIYYEDEGSFNWRCSSAYVVEESKTEEGDEFTYIYEIKPVTPDKLSVEPVFDRESAFEMVRTADFELPAPPAGFKKVSAEEFIEKVDVEMEEELVEEFEINP